MNLASDHSPAAIVREFAERRAEVEHVELFTVEHRSFVRNGTRPVRDITYYFKDLNQ